MLFDRQTDRQTNRQTDRQTEQFLLFEWQQLLSLDSSAVRSKSVCGRDQIKRAAVKLIKCGELSRASRILTSLGLAPATEETAEKLASKHPTRSSALPEGNLNEETISLSMQLFLHSIQKSQRGSGCGPSGWRYEHLQVLVSDAAIARYLHAVCSCIASGEIPKSISTLLSSACLVALPKLNGDVRLIAIGEVLRRITAKSICLQLKDQLSEYFSLIQHGVATKGGADLLVHHVLLLLEENKDWVVLKTDAKTLSIPFTEAK